ncbi:unnamed protein product [Clonostachys rosea]|uniref:Uncharacterized protein n=1 Tax=Bionectria ochroleuca TaxID=29856 RepID=A0ABY6U301_BIOOC|nr:unnamed protein product [Clonostachys rosea]
MLFKLGCSKPDCAEICPNKRRQYLLRTEYMWRCEECVEHQYKKDSDLRLSDWDRYYARLAADTFLTPDARTSITITARTREIRQEASLDQHRNSCVEEIQRVVDWVEEYGSLVWDLVYGHEYGFNEAKNRLHFLRAVKVWDLFVHLDYVRKKQDPWDYEKFPRCIENLILAGRTRLSTPVSGSEVPRTFARLSERQPFRPSQPGACRTAALDEAELTQRMTGIAIQGSGSGSTLEPAAPRTVYSDAIYTNPETSTPSQPVAVTAGIDVEMKDDDDSETLSKRPASRASSKTISEAGLSKDDEDLEEEEPNYIL